MQTDGIKEHMEKEKEGGKCYSFAWVLKKQIQDKTKDTVFQVIKEKEDLIRDTVYRKKCMLIYGLREKKNPHKNSREREEREVKKVIHKV